MISSSRDAELLSHYHSFIGQHNHIERNGGAPPGAPSPIFVVEFAPDTEDDVWVYATIGASRKPMPYPVDWEHERPERRVEYMIYSEEREPAVSDMLVTLAVQPFLKNTFHAAGHTIVGPPEGIVPDSPMEDILLTTPFFMDDGFDPVLHEDRTHTHTLWAIPIYRSERLLVRERGEEALFKLFSEHNVQTSDLRRSAIVQR